MESPPEETRPKFPLGRLVAIPGALELIQGEGREPMEFVERHVRGDFGDLSEHDRLANEQALLHGGRILSSYKVVGEERVWCLTEADRSATTILLPSDY
jgi:hypothetical protein